LKVTKNLTSAELGLTEDSVDEGDGHFLDGVAHVLSAHDDLHLEDVASALHRLECLLEHVLLVKTERSSEIGGLRSEESSSQEVGNTGGQLAIQVPAVDSAVLSVSGSSDDVSTSLTLLLDELRNDLGVMAEIGVHKDHEFSSALAQTIDVGRAETELAGAGVKLNLILTIDTLKILHNFLSAIGRIIVYDDDLHLDLPKINNQLPNLFTYSSVAVFIKSQIMRGRFSRSLYVGSRTE
jgi:hypothetical protein